MDTVNLYDTQTKLIGQALIEKITLVSHDQVVARYSVPVLG
jgi:PIN domain nuclease of toxin-antitoxin system